VSLRELNRDSNKYASLVDTNVRKVALDPDEIERLYSLCDYGTMSTRQKVETSDVNEYSEANLDYFLDTVSREEVFPALGAEESTDQIYYTGSQGGGHGDSNRIHGGSSDAADALNQMEASNLSYDWNDYA
jgi:hypothetical protein